jgi:excisionase family DNA binding protein
MNTEPVSLPPFVTADEIAKLLRLNIKTIRAALKRREIPAVRVGQQWRISRQIVITLLEGKSVPRARSP